MISVPASAQGLIGARAKRLTTLWKITRTDGQILRFTAHDRAIVFEGSTFSPAGAMVASARRREGSGKDANFEARGIISSDKITSEDLRGGKYRDARVDEYLVDWRYPFAGAVSQDVYWIGDASFDGENWHAEIEGPTRWLKTSIGHVFGRNCTHVLGDSGCGVNLAGFTTSGVTVVAMVDGERRRILRANPVDLSGAHVDNHFRDGVVTFSSGANNGLRGEVQAYTQATRQIELQLPMPYDIAVGDTFTIVAGCDRLWSTCVTKFTNGNRFRGFRFMPTADRVMRTHPQS